MSCERAPKHKKRLIFHLLSHQYHQQFEQKYENKREKSGSNVENSLELMLSQCCESSLTLDIAPTLAVLGLFLKATMQSSLNCSASLMFFFGWRL